MIRLRTAALACLALIPASASGVAALPVEDPCIPIEGINDRCPDWTGTYAGAFGSDDTATDLAVTPDGSTVITMGTSFTDVTGVDTVLVASDASTGAQRWAATYAAEGTALDAPSALEVSRDGSLVFVTGSTCASATDLGTCDLTLAAFETASGAAAWDRRVDGPNQDLDAGSDLAVSPDGDVVYVAGLESALATGADASLLAVDVASGDLLWDARYDGARGMDSALRMTTSSDGERVFITGLSSTPSTGSDIATIAFDAEDGEQLWAIRRDDHGGDDAPTAIAFGEERVLVTGTTDQGPGGAQADYVTIAYDDETGETLWTVKYNGGTSETPLDLALSPDQATAYVTGMSRAATGGYDWATVAYDAATGTQIWVKRFNGLANNGDAAWSLVPSADGEELYVAGDTLLPQAIDYTHQVLAYDADDGTVLWSALHRGAGSLYGTLRQRITLSPNGHTLFYATIVLGTTADADFLTLAYDVS